MKILILAGRKTELPAEKFDFTIGVDRGSLYLTEGSKDLDLAVGDFDSLNQSEFEQVKAHAKQLIKLPAEKDETDLEVALLYAIEHYPKADYIIYGALGGRLDHELTNIYLPSDERFRAFSEQISLVDSQNLMKYYLAGQHEISRNNAYKYIGFVQVERNQQLEIKGAKYPLLPENNIKQIWASNEFISDSMTISFDKGMIIAIYSKD